MASNDWAEERKQFLGHPAGLFVLFLTELWERFSFYGMRALLVLYMTQQLLFTDDFSYGIYGAYGALVYATPIIGGLIADRILGFKRAIVLGGVLMVVGHFAMAFDQESLSWVLGAAATPLGDNVLEVTLAGSTFNLDTTYFLYSALALLILGNGFFKPNISSLVGRLYDAEDADDAKRDGGFTIFYMGINIGAFLAPLTCGYVGETYGWHYGFGLAGVGMALGLVLFLSFQDLLYGHGEPEDPAKLDKKVLPGISLAHAIYIGSFLAVPVVAFVVTAQGIMSLLLGALGLIVLAGMLVVAFQSDKVQRDRIFVILVLILFTTTFWSFFEQAGSSMTLYAERNIDRMVFGWEVPASIFQSVNPAYIILLAPVFAWLWQMLKRHDLEPSTPVKFGLGLIQLGLGFAVIVLGASFADGNGMVPVIFLMLGYLLHTTGELSLSPVGLSKVTQLAPKKLVGAVMGAWFLSSSFAHYIAAIFAKLTSSPEGGDVKTLTALETLPIYTDVFQTIAIISIAVGVVCLMMTPIIKKWMHGVT
jgi:POT family proton-dependent oligopeptide transporter